LSEIIRDGSLYYGFECIRMDSSVCGTLFPVMPHSHYFSEMMLVRSGTCRVLRGNQAYVLKPGELLYIAPLMRHSVESEDGGPVVFDVIKFSGTRLREIPSYIADLRSIAADAAQKHLPVRMSAEEVRAFHMDDIIQECICENARQDFAWDLHIRALLYLLITGLARFWISRRDALADQLPREHNPIRDIPAYIEQHISEPLRVEELAKRCSLSYPWFAKCFHEIYGISCKQFIEQIRIEAVEQYLVYSDLDLSQISSRTGYTDCSHMVKDFRRLRGITPGQFRSMMKIQGHAPFSRFSGDSVPNHPPKG